MAGRGWGVRRGNQSPEVLELSISLLFIKWESQSLSCVAVNLRNKLTDSLNKHLPSTYCVSGSLPEIQW